MYLKETETHYAVGGKLNGQKMEIDIEMEMLKLLRIIIAFGNAKTKKIKNNAPTIAFHGNVILCFITGPCMQPIHITHRALLPYDRRLRSRETNESPKIQKSLHAVIT